MQRVINAWPLAAAMKLPPQHRTKARILIQVAIDARRKAKRKAQRRARRMTRLHAK